jgi:subtilisin family serine protease
LASSTAIVRIAPADTASAALDCAGLDASHPDLGAKPNIVTGSGTCTGTGKTKSCFAWNRDDMGLGTHVAGIIAALGNK